MADGPDTGTGFVNAAVRWYNPSTGNLTSTDTRQNAPTPAVNANPYTDGNDDPLNNSDQLGHQPCSVKLQWLP